MATLLHIDSSPRGAQSVSRRLAREFVDRWLEAHPDGHVTYRDLTQEQVPFITGDWIAGAFSAPDQRTPDQQAALTYSEAAVDELLAADVIVIGAPMHNFNISTHLKAYIDQVVRSGRTFRFKDGYAEGLAKGKKVFVISSRGSAYGPGAQLAPLNHQTPYLKTVLSFIGINDVTFVDADAQSIPQQAAVHYSAALSQLQQAAI